MNYNVIGVAHNRSFKICQKQKCWLNIIPLRSYDSHAKTDILKYLAYTNMEKTQSNSFTRGLKYE